MSLTTGELLAGLAAIWALAAWLVAVLMLVAWLANRWRR